MKDVLPNHRHRWLVEVICDVAGIDYREAFRRHEALLCHGLNRHPDNVKDRHLIFWLMRQCGYSYLEIAAATTGTSHAQVYAGVGNVNRQRKESDAFKESTDMLALMVEQAKRQTLERLRAR